MNDKINKLFFDCTQCGEETPWRTLDINDEALCHKCGISKMGKRFKQ